MGSMNKAKKGLGRRRKASALITTLLVVVVLSTIVVAFMQSMSVERMVANSQYHRYQAELAAEAGAAAAVNLIGNSITNPVITSNTKGVNFLTWAYSPSTNFAPFYVGILPEAIPATNSTNSVMSVSNTRWLVSLPSSNNTTLPFDAILDPAATNVANMNRKNTGFGQKSYWIDSSGTSYPAGWVNIATNTRTGAILRYAFWVDDDSARVDMLSVGANQVMPAGTNYRPIPQNLIVSGATNKPYFSGADMISISQSRPYLAGLTPATIRQFVPANTNLKGDLISLTLAKSSGSTGTNPGVMDLVPYGPNAGQPKMQLNDVVPQTTTATRAEKLQRIYQIYGWITNSLPEYAMRKNSPNGNVMRLAASIHDYIDPSSFPTISDYIETNLVTSIFNAWNFVYGTPGYRATNPMPLSQQAPNWSIQDWANTITNLPSSTNIWYGIKRVPFVNAMQLNIGPVNSASNSLWAKYTIYLWNPHQTNIIIPDVSMMVWNFPRGSVGSSRHDTGEAVGGLPYYAFDIVNIGAINLAPRAMQAFARSNFFRTTNSSTNIFNTTTMGWILFSGNPTSGIHILDGFRVSGGNYQYNAGSGIVGGQTTDTGEADRYWDVKDRRHSLALHQRDWTPSTSLTNGNLARFQDLTKWYDQPAAGSGNAISSIAQAPMKDIAELANIFDPINDFGVGSPVSTPAGQRYVSRGGKTLVVGLFDPFFDQYQSNNLPRNPMTTNASTWSSYEKYLRFADAAMLDIFTVKTPAESQQAHPLNVNVPRPKSLNNDALDPFATYYSVLRSAMPTNINVNTLQNAQFLADAVRQRLSGAGTNWQSARPFRNYSDLTLLGIGKDSLVPGASLQMVSSNSFFRAKATSTANPNYFLKNATVLTVKLNGDRAPSRNEPVLSAPNYDRQQPFVRLASQMAFRSYRYRIYAMGQLVSANGRKVFSTAYESYVLDLRPSYDPATGVVYQPVITKFGEDSLAPPAP